MIINPNFPGGTTHFCDDIRHEVTGKMTLVGTYLGGLFVTGALPITITQLCALIEFRFLPETMPFDLSIKVSQSGIEEPLFEAKMNIAADAQSSATTSLPTESDAVSFNQFVWPVPMRDIVISEPCFIKVRAYIGDDEIRIGSLQILIGQSVEPVAIT